MLSPAERSFLHDSLIRLPPIRPDRRADYQFRPLEAKTGFLPGSNGSARIRLMDGSECIISVKSKVVITALESALIECDVDISGHRDDSNYVSNLKYNLETVLLENFPTGCLNLTTKYSYKLFIDCIVISHALYPLGLMSLACYLALKTSRLPLLISEVNDADIEEQPTFSDDWDEARNLAEMPDFHPPISIVAGVIGSNILFDPSAEEVQVLENGLLLTWYNGKVISPVSNINLATNSKNTNFKGLGPHLITKSISMAQNYCGDIVKALDSVIDLENNAPDTIF
jgi:exosome complex component RRP42